MLTALTGCTPDTSSGPAASASSPAGATADTTTTSPAPPASIEPPASAAPGAGNGAEVSGGSRTAVAVLASLEVKGRAPKTGYSREQFGDGWVDVDHNGCDTRNDVLARDLTDETFKPGTRDCVVATGTLADPYSGKSIAFTSGQGTSSAVQIDHVVALSDAWQKAPSSGTAPSGSRSPTTPRSCWPWTDR